MYARRTAVSSFRAAERKENRSKKRTQPATSGPRHHPAILSCIMKPPFWLVGRYKACELPVFVWPRLICVDRRTRAIG